MLTPCVWCCTISYKFANRQEDMYMGLTISSSGTGDRETLPVGQYSAVCYKIVDVGTRMETFQQDDPKKRTSVCIYWEVLNPKMADGRPFSIMKQYTSSLNENATLHKDLKSWRGKSFTEEELRGFEIQNILSVSAQLEVAHTEGGNAKVVSVFKPDGGAKKTPTVNAAQVFDLEVYCREFNGKSDAKSKEMCDVFADLPSFMQEMVNESFEMKAAESSMASPSGVDGLAAIAKKTSVDKESSEPVVEFDDDIPF